MQTLQRQAMLKRLQELQRHQQLQELGDSREQNYLNQQGVMNRRALGDQFFLPNNGTAVRDSSQMPMGGNMNLGLQNASLSLQGFPNGFYPQAQGQDQQRSDLAPQQLNLSLYGTPVASARNNLTQYNNLQGLSNIYANGMTRARDNQAEKHLMQSSGFNNFFLNDPHSVSSNQLCVPDRALMSKQVTPEKNLFGQVPLQGFNSGDLLPKYPQANTAQANASVQEFSSSREEQHGWAGPEKPQDQSSSPLDALERKILFNLDGDTSFGGAASAGTGGVKDLLEQIDGENSFPSLQSGSWSALMHCAVAEASSSDTGLQEEWSGLSFQNIEPSTDNQAMNLLESGNQKTGWVDNNVQSAASSQFFLNNSNTSSGFPGFQKSAAKFPTNQKDGLCSDSSPESVQQSPRHAVSWLDGSTAQNPSIKANQAHPMISNPGDAWHSQGTEPSKSEANQQSAYQLANLNYSGHKNATSTTFNNENAANNSWPGDINVPMQETKGSDRGFLEAEKNYELNMASNSMGRSGLVKGSQLNYFESVPNSGTGMVHHQAQGHQQFHAVKRADTSSINRASWNLTNENHHMTNHNEVQSQTLEDQQDCYQAENSSGSHLSNASEHHTGDPEVRQNMLPREGTSQSVNWSNQNLTGQVLQGRTSNEQGHRDAVGLEKRNLKASGEAGNIGANKFPSFHTSGGTSGQNLSFQPRHSGLRFAPSSQGLPSSSFFSTPSSPQTEKTAAAMAPGSSNVGLQLQRPQLTASFSGTSNRVPHFDNATSHGNSRSAFPYPFAQEFPALEAALVNPSFTGTGLSQQVRSTLRPHSVSKNVLSQNLSGTEANKVSSSQPPYADSRHKGYQTTVRGVQGRPGENTYGGPLSLEVGKDQQGKGAPEQKLSPEITAQVSDAHGLGHGQKSAQNNLSQANAIFSGSLMARSPRQDIVRAQQRATQYPADTARDLEAFGYSLKPSNNLHQNYSLLQQIFSSKRVLEKNHGGGSGQNVQQSPAIAGNQLRMYGQKPEAAFLGHNGLNESSQLVSFPVRDVNMLSFSSNVGEDQTGKASSSYLKDTPQEIVAPRSNSESHHDHDDVGTARSQNILPTTPFWFKNYGTLGNRQISQMFDATAVKNSEHGVLTGKPLQDFPTVNSLLSANAAGVSQVGSAWPNIATALSVDRPSSSSIMPLDVRDRTLTVLRPKKRKIEVLPWHKEVETSKRLHDISSVEELWALATNRLTDKVEVTDEMQPLLRAKRRLVATTQLVQELFQPPPLSILKLDPESYYDTVVYFMSRLALGDACSLTSSVGSDMMPETGKKRHHRSVEEFTKRIETLENNFLRLEKSPSLVGLGVEQQDMEKFSVYTRFAKFHSRGQPAAAADSSTIPKSYPTRYVTVNPMLEAEVPEGVQCLSL